MALHHSLLWAGVPAMQDGEEGLMLTDERHGSREPHGTGTEPSFGRDLALGTAIGGSLGGLGAVLSRFPVGPPTLRCGALGGGLAACYLPITRFLGEQRGVDDPANHALAGSVSGYAAASVLSGVGRPLVHNAGILVGAAAGVGIFFGLGAFERWRMRTGQAMAQRRAQEKPLDDVRKAWANGCLTRDEYMDSLGQIEREWQRSEASAIASKQTAASKSAQRSWWSDLIPIRHVSDEEVAEIQRERQRMEQIRQRMELQRLSDKFRDTSLSSVPALDGPTAQHQASEDGGWRSR